MFKFLLKRSASNQPPRPQVATVDDISPMSSCSMPSESLSYSSTGLALDQPIVLDPAMLHKESDDVPDSMFNKEALGGNIPKKVKKRPSDPKKSKTSKKGENKSDAPKVPTQNKEAPKKAQTVVPAQEAAPE